jgi:hypothetical protein
LILPELPVEPQLPDMRSVSDSSAAPGASEPTDQRTHDMPECPEVLPITKPRLEGREPRVLPEPPQDTSQAELVHLSASTLLPSPPASPKPEPGKNPVEASGGKRDTLDSVQPPSHATVHHRPGPVAPAAPKVKRKRRAPEAMDMFLREHKPKVLNGIPIVPVPSEPDQWELARVLGVSQTMVSVECQRAGHFAAPTLPLPQHIVRDVCQQFRCAPAFVYA